MSGAQGKSKRPKDSETGRSKRPKWDQSNGHNGAEGSAVDVLNHPQTASSTDSPAVDTNEPPSTSGLPTDSPSTLNAPGRWAEVVLEFNINFSDKEKRKDHLKEVWKAEIALRNCSGGIIKINSPHVLTAKNRDSFINGLYEERKKSLGSESGEKDLLDDIIDIKHNDFSIFIFVRKSLVTITTYDSYLRQRSDGRNYKVQLYSQICNVLNRDERACICVTEGKFKTSFCLGDTLSYETITEEYKELKSNNLAKALCEKLSDNILSFANTRGGTVYFGIRDIDASIIGQKIKDDEEKTDIKRCISECMRRKLWFLKSGERVIPKESDHYHIEFFPVQGADASAFVIAVHVCLFPGAAVFGKEPECSVLDEHNQVVDMEIKEWLALHERSFIGNESDEKKLSKKNLGGRVHYSVKGTIPDIVKELKEDTPRNIKQFPSNAVETINNELLSRFMKSAKLMLKKNEWQGIAFIERCWKFNLDLPDTRPDGVICDVLLCSSHFPLILVTLTNSRDTSKSTEYNIEVATRLKKVLVKEGGCLEKIYIKPVTISSSDEVNTSNLIRTLEYPVPYNAFTDRKYTSILQALVLVLARAHSMTEYKCGQKIFKLLTKEQWEILFHKFKSPQLMIKGPPGCGKTVLAIERIHRLRRDKCTYKEVLFVCSNKPLKEKIRKMKHDNEPLCLVRNYFEIFLCVESRPRSGFEFKHLKHIVADEVQNYKQFPNNTLSDWWKQFVKKCKSCQSIWVFSDLSQKIHTEPCVHAQLKEFPSKELDSVIRMTGEIYNFLYDIGKLKELKTGIHLAHDLDGEKVQVLIPKRPSQVESENPQSLYTDTLILVLHRLIVRQGYSKNRIAVLFTDQKQCFECQKSFYNNTKNCEVRSGEEVRKRGVVFDTIRRYSGDEKDTIIVFLPEYYTSDQQDNEALILTAGSRAIMKLILILEDEYEAQCFGLEDFESIEVPKRILVTDFAAV